MEDGLALVWLPDPGEGRPGASSTLNTSACPNDGTASSLSGVLVARCHRRFYLSSQAARGILRRALRRGRSLPGALEASLRALAGPEPIEVEPEETTTGDDSQMSLM